LWLGVAAARPFLKGYYHPGAWRRRLDFGVGTLGDMACHIFDPVFGALGLGSPVSVRSDGPAPNKWNWATSSRVTLEFEGTPFTAGDKILLHWSDGGSRPPREVLALANGANGRPEVPGSGSIFIGTEGTLVLPHIALPRVYPRDRFAAWNKKLQTPKLGYFEPKLNHWGEFIKAVRGEGKTEVNFDYAGPLTEAVLFGSVAVRFPKPLLKWNARQLTFDLPEANNYVRRDYRDGWKVAGLS
jgi:predicted dehydrogenase